MFTKRESESKLDAEIDSLLAKLSESTDAAEYDAILERITKLHKLKPEDRSKRVSPDTVLVVVANLIGIFWIARYEKENVIKSKEAMKFVMKPR
jgi:hypothetical protein